MFQPILHFLVYPLDNVHFFLTCHKWATIHGQWIKKLGVEIYAGRSSEHQDKTPRQSEFSLSLYGQRWIYGMELWNDWVISLIALKPHK